MTDKAENMKTLVDSGVIGVIRLEKSEKLVKVARAIKRGRVNCIEVAMTEPNALSVTEAVTEELEDVMVGHGNCT
ncbi:MAG: hypothetical protein V5A83_05200 [Candidatus Bipolaricaulota bacterium]|nr:hypothetical protein [Candidatus Bipolaricaulota bacterium]